jgi:hypothetical protein
METLKYDTKYLPQIQGKSNLTQTPEQYKMLKLAEKEQLAAYIAKVEKQQAAYALVLPELEKLKGKTINKRIETKLKTVFPDIYIKFKNSYSWWELDIEGLCLNIGYYSQGQELKDIELSPIESLFDQLPVYKNQLENYDSIVESFRETEANYESTLNQLGLIKIEYLNN